MEFISYTIKSALVLSLFSVVYQFILRKETHYTANRVFLLAGLLSSIFLPLVNIKYPVLVESMQGLNTDMFIPIEDKPASVVPSVNESGVEENSINWLFIGFCFYVVTVLWIITRIGIQLLKVLKISGAAHKRLWNGKMIYIHPAIKTPFVFYNRIYLGDTSYFDKSRESILIHEQTHLMQKHWIDLFLCEGMLALQWFNPFAWYYGRVVRENLEFLADRGVLESGFKLDAYLKTIICETMGAEAIVLANHFRISQNKRRLKMMKIVKTSKWRQLKLLLMLPMIGLVLWAFSEPVYHFVDKQTDAMERSLKSNRSSIKKFPIKGVVCKQQDTTMVQDPQTKQFVEKVIGEGLPGTSIVIKGTKIGTVADEYGSFKLDVEEGDVLVFSFVGYKTQELKIVDQKKPWVLMEQQSYMLKPGVYREKYKGKITPPPPPPAKTSNKEQVPPPPPLPSKSDESVFYVVEEMPAYKEGMEGYFAYLYTLSALAAKEKNLSGKVNVEFTIDTNGDLVKVKALDKPGSNEALEAVTIVKKLKGWKPGLQRMKPVDCTLVVPVEF